MYKLYSRLTIIIGFFLLLVYNSSSMALGKGIYVTQSTLEDTKYLTYLINRAKKVGIDTFVVDLEIPSKLYARNIELIKNNNLNYVARIVVFSNGGDANQVINKAIWEKKLKLANHAISYGAKEIQFDYIRYNTKQKPSVKNAENVAEVIRWFRNEIPKNIPLQVDVFGVASFGPELHIGQDLKLISPHVDRICPMVYPSHYEPYRHHAERPYQTIYESLDSIKEQFDYKYAFKLNPYIELSNYRYPLSKTKKLAYIRAQLKAVKDAGADGWYAWSPHNKYDSLFDILEADASK